MAGAETPSLNGYLQQVQRFIADTGQTLTNPDDLGAYVNRARREVAMRTQSIRILTSIGGEITHIQVTDPGRGYRNPRVRITYPDAPSGELPYPGGAQATAIAQQIGGQISDVSVEFGGSGYFRPQVHIEDEEDEHRVQHGGGARAEAYTVPLLRTEQHREVYKFSDIPLQQHPGVAEVFACKSISFIYANYRYSVPVFPFSVYQAYVRIYPQQYLYIPTAAAQFGQGVNGSLFMYPIPSHDYQMELDVFCLPQDMEDDQDFEAIPKPWTDAVPYFAAHLAYLGLQNLNAAQYYMNLYDEMCKRYSTYARPGRAINPYGRWSAFT